MAEPATPLPQALEPARERFATWLSGLPRDARLIVFCHSDADGLASGALLGRGLPRLGFDDVHVLPSSRGESAFSEPARARLREVGAQALIVADLGVNEAGVLSGVPTLYIDHHRPSGEPGDAVVILAYRWDPIPCSAWLTFELLAAVTPVEDLAWIAAIGVIGDLGAKAPWPALPAIRKRYSARWLQEAVVLINAARRAAAYDVETPLRLLMETDHPRAVAEDVSRGAHRLHAYREEVYAELKQARRHAPHFSATGPYALIRLHSACQIHPLIAQQWRGRLPKYAVIAANTGYLPGLVSFSMRTARTDLNLPRLLQSIDLDDVDARYGQGHRMASGGTLSPRSFERLLHELGFA
jgi:single-stranded-DNA-specific exonuclease